MVLVFFIPRATGEVVMVLVASIKLVRYLWKKVLFGGSKVERFVLLQV